MYFTDFLLGLRRRWYVALVGLILTAGLAIGAALAIPVTYTSTTSLLMLPPRSALGTNDNPYLNLGGLNQALEVLATRINASPVTEDLVNSHPDAAFEVGEDLGTTGPILLITVTADSPGEATEVRDRLAELAPTVLADMQNELRVQVRSQIPLSVLAEDRLPKREIKSQLRAVIAVVALAGGATILGTGYLDYLLALRSGTTTRRRRSRRSALPAGDWWDESSTQAEQGRTVKESPAADLPTHAASVHDEPEEHRPHLDSWFPDASENHEGPVRPAGNGVRRDKSLQATDLNGRDAHHADSLTGTGQAPHSRGH